MVVDAARTAAVRAFTRSYTAALGVLDEHLLRSPFSLTEARVVYELAQRDVTEAADLRRSLGLDAGYLSRILSRFETTGLVTRDRSGTDARRQRIRLTPAGRDAFATLDAQSSAQVGGLLGDLDDVEQGRLVDAMGTVRAALGQWPATPVEPVLRGVQPGDLGWVVQRHGALYAQEYGWDRTFEGLVARIVADYAETADPVRENAWIAEIEGWRVGSVFLVADDASTARLRLLLVEPAARGHGLGGRLVDECVRFARDAGYTSITLWTNDVLVAAQRIYERAAFRLTGEQAHHSFGNDLVGQHWQLGL
ncbi:MAG TPA: bifunctional helix-turn-helix transcriptional regulator/GNAT family N-acetyltransferase [Jiangellaceae bacterium]|nr:bifunctional helix-turn-helix transcriptional regulator/GNAT family N-acetyltransferase [Jiangellaceae bacterium]